MGFSNSYCLNSSRFYVELLNAIGYAAMGIILMVILVTTVWLYLLVGSVVATLQPHLSSWVRVRETSVRIFVPHWT